MGCREACVHCFSGCSSTATSVVAFLPCSCSSSTPGLFHSDPAPTMSLLCQNPASGSILFTGAHQEALHQLALACPK